MSQVSIIKIPKCVGCYKKLDPRMTFFPLCEGCKVFLGFALKAAKKDFGHKIAKMSKESREKMLLKYKIKKHEVEI